MIRLTSLKPKTWNLFGISRALIRGLNEYFKTKVEIPRIRVGKKQEIETLINEEAMLLGMYLRN